MDDADQKNEIIKQLIEKLDDDQTKQFIDYLKSVVYIE